MKVAVAYVFPMVNALKHQSLARRFNHSLRAFDPGHHYELHVCSTGGQPTLTDIECFDHIQSEHWHPTDNFGWDIGAFQWCAEHLHCDLLVCLGCYCHFYRHGWLARMVDVYLDKGPGLYGCWGYLEPNWHIRTTAFWITPELLDSYPSQVGSSRKERYEFEHGGNSITRHVLSLGYPVSVVSFTETWDHPNWRDCRIGDGDCLLFDQFTFRGKEMVSR